jgi:methyltransferase (TIGR00027 family)
MMTTDGPLIRDISDTARWVAAQRARETERPDAVFCDPFARRLAGERGEQIAVAVGARSTGDWPYVARTVLIDRFITEQVRQGADMVVDLAAGLDTRPYRMQLPATLRWVEVDLPEILDHKEAILAGEKPACALERFRLDLSNVEARRELFGELGARAASALILTEGLLAYLTAEEVALFAQDLAKPPSFRRWVLDLMSPGLVRMMTKRAGAHLDRAGAPLKFGPHEGPEFFMRYGWKPIEVHSLLQEAARLKRLPFLLRFFAWFPERNGQQGSRPWSGICLFEKQ